MITMQQFLLRQPAAPQETTTDKYYFALANRLVEEAREKKLFASYPEKVIERAALALIGYYQDVICDSGIWHAFIDECGRLYGHKVPFYDNGEGDYTDYELNRIDVRFMVWYALSMNYEELRVRNPFEPELLAGADAWFETLDGEYDEAPLPEDYRLAHELELHAPEDQEALYKLGNWLFMHCYLMTPAYAMTLNEIASRIDFKKEDAMIELQKQMEQSMAEDPTGPLAFFLGEWLHLIVRGRLPKVKTEQKEEHKYFTAFTKATGGDVIKFFGSYGELNDFFISALGWAEGEEHLPQLKGEKDFILKVDPQKGMLLAKNIARCIACQKNPYYDKVYAREHAIELLTVRGVCPGDLLKYVCTEGWLPDATFPGSESHELVKSNWDFIGRCFLQQYYVGD